MSKLLLTFLLVHFSSSSFTDLAIAFSGCYDPRMDYDADSGNTIEKSFSTTEQTFDLKVAATGFTVSGENCADLKIRVTHTDTGKSAYIYYFKDPDEIENADAAIIKSEEEGVNQIQIKFQDTLYFRIKCPNTQCKFKISFQLQTISMMEFNEVSYMEEDRGLFILRDATDPSKKRKFNIFLKHANPEEEISFVLLMYYGNGTQLLGVSQYLSSNEHVAVIDENKLDRFNEGYYQVNYNSPIPFRTEVKEFTDSKPKFRLNKTIHEALGSAPNNEECLTLFNIPFEENNYTFEAETGSKNIKVSIVDGEGNTQKSVDLDDDSKKFTLTLKGKDLMDANVCFKTSDSSEGNFAFIIIGDGLDPEEEKDSKSNAGLIAGVTVAAVVVAGAGVGVPLYLLKIRKPSLPSSNNDVHHSRQETNRPMNTEQIEPEKVEVQK